MNLEKLAEEHGTPLYVYDKMALQQSARELINLDAPFGHTVRYAVKANSNPEIIKLFDNEGLHFDASSTYEANELLGIGITGKKISLASQSLSGPLEDVLDAGVLPVATSLRQIDLLAEAGKGKIAIRVNSEIGSGHNNRTNVGGPNSSFGIWHDYFREAVAKADDYGMVIDRLHMHIGSGADPNIWREVIKRGLDFCSELPEVETLDIGGGYKIDRMEPEKNINMSKVFDVFSDELAEFNYQTWRNIKLEIEPGTYLVANAGILLAEVEDVKDTGEDGRQFLVINTGMNDILRPTLYGAQHPIEVLNDNEEQIEYVISGHNCESGDILTPEDGNPEEIKPRMLNRADAGDLIAIRGVGAYCEYMSAKGYNSFPPAKSVVA